MPELISLRPCPQGLKCRGALPQYFPLNSLVQRSAIERSLFEPAEHRLKCRGALPQYFPLNSLVQRSAIERSLFEPAEHRPARRETDSESSRRLPEPGFQVAQLGSPVAMTQRREATSKCFE